MVDPYAMAKRAWYAYQCLQRDERGNAPSIRGLESDHHLANAQIYKLVYGISKRPGFPELSKMARALNTTPEYIAEGSGQGPFTRHQVEPWPGPRDQAAKKSASKKRRTG